MTLLTVLKNLAQKKYFSQKLLNCILREIFCLAVNPKSFQNFRNKAFFLHEIALKKNCQLKIIKIWWKKVLKKVEKVAKLHSKRNISHHLSFPAMTAVSLFSTLKSSIHLLVVLNIIAFRFQIIVEQKYCSFLSTFCLFSICFEL